MPTTNAASKIAAIASRNGVAMSATAWTGVGTSMRIARPTSTTARMTFRTRHNAYTGISRGFRSAGVELHPGNGHDVTLA